MAGGTWTSQTKVRPGAYINFKAVQRGSLNVGDRGVMAIGLPLHWGVEGELIEVLSSDLLNGNSKKLIGLDVFDADSKLLRAGLSYCYKAFVYRLKPVDSSAVSSAKATATLGKLTATAKYTGTLGNKLTAIVTSSNGIYTIISYLDGVEIDKQKFTTISQLVSNDYIDFTEESSGSITTGTLTLTGGVDGVATSLSSQYTSMIAKLELAKWQTFACTTNDTTCISSIITFIDNLRNDEGRYVQAVVANASSANDEGIINNVCGAVIDGVTFTAEEFCAIVAGMTAGANFNESNTARVVDNATSIVGQLTDEQIKTALSNGKFVLSSSASGNIKVEQDINSLHNYPSDKNYSFSKNRVIRTLDEIGTSIKETWEDVYMGKVDNNETGRALFKADIVQYMVELQRLNAIQNFEIDDVVVSQGTELDAVVVDLAVMPVDSMEKLYMTINVNS